MAHTAFSQWPQRNQRLHLERDETEGREREETMTREVLSSTGVTVRTRKRLSCHEGKINQIHLITRGTEGAGIMNGGRSLHTTAYLGGCRRKISQSWWQGRQETYMSCWQERKSEMLGLLSSAGFLIGDWSSPSSQGCADSWEYCPSGQAGQGSRPLQKFTKKFSKDSNHDPKHKWDCHFL